MGNLTIIDNLTTQPVADTLREVDQFLKTQPGPDAVAQLVKDLYGFGTKIMNNNPEAAEKLFRKVTEIDPNYANGYINWGFSLSKQGRNDEAVEKYKISLTKSPEPALAVDVLKWLGGKDIKRFQDVLEALQAQPDLVEPLDKEKLIGDMAFQLGDFTKAAEAYERALELSPSDPFILKSIGDTFLNQKEDTTANQYFTQAIDIVKKQIADAQQALATSDVEPTGQPGANEWQQQLDTAYQTLAKLHYEIGDTFFRLEADEEDVWAYWQEAIRIAPQAASTLSIADSLYNKGQWKKAASAYSTYHQTLGSPDASLLFYLGLCHYYSYNYQEAELSLQKAAELEGNYQYYANYWLGVLYSGQRRFEEAEPYYRKAFRLKADEYFIIEGLILCLTALGKKDEALAICQRIKAKYATSQERSAELTYLIGNIHLDFKELDKAITYYQEALRQDPLHVFARHNMAHILEKKGDYGKARDEWAKAKANYENLLAKPVPA